MLTKTPSLKLRVWEQLEVSVIRLFFNIAKIISFKISLNLALSMAKEISGFQDQQIVVTIPINSLRLGSTMPL